MKRLYRDRRLHECPCYNCICVPICRSRWYQNMLRNCEKISAYIYDDPECGANPVRNDDYYDRMQITRVALFKEIWR